MRLFLVLAGGLRKLSAPAGMKIFAVTGRARAEFQLEDGGAGIDRWFSKPLDPEALLNELNQAALLERAEARPA